MSCNCPLKCNPCKNNCPDDGEILEAEILPADECWGGCGCSKWCKDNCWINIQSTNECLEVNTSECGVVKLTATCPPKVTAWDNVTVEVEDCDDENCSLNYIVSADCKDEKVKVQGCGTPDYLWNLVKAWDGITLTKDCNELRINVDRSIIPTYTYPELEISGDSQLINLSVGWSKWHTIYISDKPRVEDNMCMVGFTVSKEYTVPINGDTANAEKPARISTDPEDEYTNWWWGIYTWNPALATINWIRIVEDWHYWVYWQLTVCNNRKQTERYINLWRALLRIKWDRSWLWKYAALSTSKHWAYAEQVVLRWWTGISIDQNGVIKNNRATISVWEGWGTYEVVYDAWGGIQPQGWFDGPWATHNIWVFVDLHAWDVITLWYRAQSNMPESKEWKEAKFEIVWANDSSTKFRSLFWWTQLWVVMLSHTLFQQNNSADNSEIFQFIWQ